jgi:oligopeptide/dipeptide ABC transporter ATP-binding protein
VLRLFDALRRDLDMALILISHDLALIAQHCVRLLVMYAGQCVESGLAADVLRAPAHPYTAALLACRPDGRRSPGVPLPTLPGSATGAARLTTCRFEPRCAMAESICSRPPTLEAITATRRVRCWRVHEQTGV